MIAARTDLWKCVEVILLVHAPKELIIDLKWRKPGIRLPPSGGIQRSADGLYTVRALRMTQLEMFLMSRWVKKD
jgi:hypothetical protein